MAHAVDALCAATRYERKMNSTAQTRTEGREDARVALLSVWSFWLFYYLLTTFRAWFYDAGDQFGMMGKRSVVTLCGVALTALLWLVLRRFRARKTGVLVTAAFLSSFPVALAYAAINYTMFYVVDPLPSTLMEQEKYADKMKSPLAEIFGAALEWYFFIVAWAVLYVALTYAAKVRTAERQAAAYRAEAQTAQLRALRYQVNPHFLFNTLNSLSSLVLAKRNAEAEAMILNLSNFFRTSLTSDPAADVRLADEIELQRLYLAIEQTRFPQRLRVDIEVPDDLTEARVPGLILQPLVENAIKYGVATSRAAVRIAVTAFARDGRLHLTVEDDGDASEAPAAGHGVGLRNVCDRLAARFGDAASCTHGARYDGGYRVELSMPLNRG